MADAEAKVPDYRLLLSCPSGLSPSQVLISHLQLIHMVQSSLHSLLPLFFIWMGPPFLLPIFSFIFRYSCRFSHQPNGSLIFDPIYLLTLGEGLCRFQRTI